MDLKNTQLKDTYGNLLTIGTTAGSPQTGTLQNGDGEDITSLTLAGNITASKNQDATSSFTFQNTDTTGTNVRTHLNVIAGNRSVRLEAIHDDYGYLVSNSARLYLQTNSGSNNPVYLDGDDVIFNGQVGIGETSPTNALEIKRTGATSVSIALNQTGTGGRNYVLLSSGTGYGTAGNLVFYDGTASAERMRIDSSGNVGIGTDAPASKLQVAGTIDVNTASSGLPTIKLSHTNTGADNFEIKAGTTGVANSGFSIRDVDASANRLVIDSDGNVGIGTDAPEKKLQVSGDAKIDTFLTVGDSGQANTYLYLLSSTSGTSNLRMGDTDTDAGAIIYSNASNFMDFRVNASERLRIDSDGNVGIGTDNPATRLDIQGVGGATTSPSVTATTGTSYIGWKSVNTGGSFWTAIDNSTGSSFSTGTAYARVLWSNGAYPMVFSTNSTERLRIDSSGNITHSGTSPQYIFKTASNTNFQIAVQENVSNALEITPSTTVGGTTFSNPALVVNSSGNVLVGKTSSSNAQTTVGHLFLPDGRHYATASGGVSGIFSRTSSDGDILSFYKDGTTVGSIGASSGRLYIGSDDTSIFFDSGDSPSLRPHGPVDPDGVIDIGDSGARFKDLYLSGSVGIGGTSIGAKLDIQGTDTEPLTVLNNTVYTFAGNVTTSQSNTHTVTIPFTSQGSQHSNFIVEIYASLNWTDASTTFAGRALYTLNAFTSVSNIAELEDVNNGNLSFSATASGMNLIVTITTTATGGQEPNRIGVMAKVIRGNGSVGNQPTSMTIA
jgi:hypothetical protein